METRQLEKDCPREETCFFGEGLRGGKKKGILPGGKPPGLLSEGTGEQRGEGGPLKGANADMKKNRIISKRKKHVGGKNTGRTFGGRMSEAIKLD